jgi:hypothetical protein
VASCDWAGGWGGAMVEIQNQDQLEAWLQDQPPEVAMAIASRAVLRVQPLLRGIGNPWFSKLNPQNRRDVITPIIYLQYSIWFFSSFIKHQDLVKFLRMPIDFAQAVREIRFATKSAVFAIGSTDNAARATDIYHGNRKSFSEYVIKCFRRCSSGCSNSSSR